MNDSNEIVITDEMVAAGERVLEVCASYFEERVLASMVYTAMLQEKFQSHLRISDHQQHDRLGG